MVGAAATDSITDAPDLSANGTNAVPLLAPWSNVGATASALETALGVREPCVWHKFYVPFAGTVVVTDNPPQFGDSHVPAAGDTYLYAYWSATGTLTDASPVTALTAIASDDDSGGQTKGYLTWADPGGRWIYIAHGPYSSGAQFTNQWTFITAPSGLTQDLITAAASISIAPAAVLETPDALLLGVAVSTMGIAPATAALETPDALLLGVAVSTMGIAPATAVLETPVPEPVDLGSVTLGLGVGAAALAWVWRDDYYDGLNGGAFFFDAGLYGGRPNPIRVPPPPSPYPDVSVCYVLNVVVGDTVPWTRSGGSGGWSPYTTTYASSQIYYNAGNWTANRAAASSTYYGFSQIPATAHLYFSWSMTYQYRPVGGLPLPQKSPAQVLAGFDNEPLNLGTASLALAVTPRPDREVNLGTASVVLPLAVLSDPTEWARAPGGTWVVDLGPYTGPNPQAAPPATLPGICETLTFAVATGPPLAGDPWTDLLSDAETVLQMGAVFQINANTYGPGYPPEAHYFLRWQQPGPSDLSPYLTAGQVLAGEPWPVFHPPTVSLAAGVTLDIATTAGNMPDDLGTVQIILQVAPSGLTPARGSLGEPYFVPVDGSESYDLTLCPFDASPPIVIGDPFAPSMWLSMKPMSDGILTVTMDAPFDAEMEAWVGPDYTDAPKFVRLIAWTGSEPVQLTPVPLVIGFGMIADTADEAARLTDALVLSATMILV